MKIAFFDIGFLEYDVTYPLRHPMGGTESGICYLATELARRGHAVTILNGSSHSRSSQGVEVIPYHTATQEYFYARAFDAVITVKSVFADFTIKPLLPPTTRFFLWTGHDVTVPAVYSLTNHDIMALLDGIIFVSHWQRQCFMTQLGIPANKAHVIKNAISPAFENMFADKEALATAKAFPVRLAYTSAPYRGLQILLLVFPYLTELVPEATLAIYSSMQAYHAATNNNPYNTEHDHLAKQYENAKNMKNVSYIGGVNQPELAKAMQTISVLSYPNTFPETSCIAAMEAMAAGAYIVTSDLGALAETTSGYATLVPIHDEETKNNYTYNYVKALKGVADTIRYAPEAFIERQWEQVRFANQHLTWKLRAAEWEELLAKH